MAEHRALAQNAASTKKEDVRNIAICMAVVSAAILATWPVAELPYGDDAAYAHMALHLAQTGRLVYNGWESVMQFFHTYWGALIIRLFGFSFNAVRWSTFPFTLAAVAFCYLLVRQAGLRANSAVFVTLLLGLSPLFVPLAATYMTDIPGLFFYLATLYFLVRAHESAESATGFRWLLLGVATGYLGGTSRQVVWFVPLVLLPYMGWLRRRNPRFATACFLAWVLTIAGVTLAMVWFAHQPYTEAQLSLLLQLKDAVKRPLFVVAMLVRFLLTLLLVCLPAALPYAAHIGLTNLRVSRGGIVLVASLALTVSCAVLIHPSLASIPWLPNTLNWQGILGDAPLPGRPVVLTRPVRVVCALVVYFTACIMAAQITKAREITRRVVRTTFEPGSSFTLVAMSLVSTVYLVMAILRSVDIDVFDRYLLPLLPWAATLLILETTKVENGIPILRRTMPIAWGLLALFAMYAILSTQDLWSLARARVTATRELQTSGALRTAIDAGFEYNVWTELSLSGHINNHRVLNPRGAYQPGKTQTPRVVPMYRLEYQPSSNTSPSEFAAVPYFSLMPPFHKHVNIDRVLPEPKPTQ
jgi:hypothetical protein